MVGTLLSIFIVLHGLVHLLYFGQSQRRFELQPGMLWPDGSWAFSRLLGDEPARRLASAACVLAAAAFVAGGLGIFLEQTWGRPVVVGAAALSSALYLGFWDGTRRDLDDQGGVGLLINIVLVIAVLVVWPDVDF